MKPLLLALLIIPLAYAQQLQPVESTQPDCGKFIAPITTAGTFVSATVNNKDGAGCDGWVVTYSSFGFATVSVLLQSAPLTTAGAVGTFVSFAGTIVTGFVNPVTATNQGEIRATGYFPYVRVQITTTGSGYLTAELHGFKTNPNSGVGASSGSSGCPNPCPVVGTGTAGTPAGGVLSVQGVPGGTPQPVTLPANQSVNLAQVAGTNTLTGGAAGAVGVGGLAARLTPPVGNPVLTAVWDGTNVRIPIFCGSQLAFNLAGSGNTQIIPLSGSLTTYICHIDFATTAAEDIKVTQGTGANCVTGPVDVTGLYKGVSAMAQDYSAFAPLQIPAGKEACLNQTAAQALGGVVLYTQF